MRLKERPIGGHVFSTVIGVTCYNLFHEYMWFASAAAVATAIAVMHATKTLHPPGGATALIAVIGGEKIHNLGYLYALIPAGAGAVIMLALALLNKQHPPKAQISRILDIILPALQTGIIIVKHNSILAQFVWSKPWFKDILKAIGFLKVH